MPDHHCQPLPFPRHACKIRSYLQCSECSQERQIHWIALSLPKCQKHKPDRSEQRNPHHPLIRLDPVLVGLREEGDGTEGGREEELYGQNGVDLADELHANG